MNSQNLMNRRFFITIEGYNKLEEELKEKKKNDRKQAIEDIARAKEYGDLSENYEYHAAKEKQRLIENRIREITNILSKADQIDTQKVIGQEKTQFGSKIEVLDKNNDVSKTFQLVSSVEADLDNNKISIESPMGIKMLDKKVGDTIEIKTPRETKTYLITRVNF